MTDKEKYERLRENLEHLIESLYDCSSCSDDYASGRADGEYRAACRIQETMDQVEAAE